MTLRDELKIWSDFSVPPPLNVQAGGGGGGGGSPPPPPLPLSWAGGFLVLMGFIDPRIFDSNDIHRPHPGPQENIQIGGVRCAISQSWSKFREMLGENPTDIHL